MANKIDTPEMRASKMEREHHRAKLFQSMFSFGSMAGNDELVIVDMSYWQDDALINYDLLCSNVDGFILRGAWNIYKDTRFDIHYDQISRRGKPLGVYSYLTGDQTGQAQAEALYKAMDGRPLKLGIYADVEERGTRYGSLKYKLTRPVADNFIASADLLFKRQTDVYTGPYVWQEIMGNYTKHSFRNLWIANYGVTRPMFPIGGGWQKWKYWQHTDKGTLPGYRSSLDLNRYSGTTEEWKKEFGETVIVVPPPEEKGMYTLEFVGSLYIREKPFDGRIVGGAVAGDILYSNEKPDRGWYKVTRGNVTGWVSGLTTFTRITENPTKPDPPVPGVLTLEEKVERLWKAHRELH